MAKKSEKLLESGNFTSSDLLRIHILAELEKINTSGGTSGLASETTLASILAKIIAAPATEAKQNDALGGNGTEFIFGVGVVSGKTYKYLVANEDCTFTTLTGSVTADLKTTLGITTNTVSKGMIIKGLDGETITAVTLATGSVIGVR